MKILLCALLLLTSTTAVAQNQFECLAKAVYFEAGIEPLHGMYMVAEVIMNRVASRQYPNSICDVVYQDAQFTSLPHIQKTQPGMGAKWRLSRLVAEQTIAGKAPRLLGPDVMNFFGKHIRPPWSRNMQIVAVTDRHAFVKRIR